MGHKPNRVQDVIDRALTAQNGAYMCLMLGTAWRVNEFVFDKIVSKGVNEQVAAVVAVLIAVLGASFIDGTLKGWLPYTIAGVFNKKDRKTGVERLGWFNWMVRIMTIVLLSVTTYFNLGVTPDIADKMAGEANTEKEDQRMSMAVSRYSESLAIYKDKLSDATRQYDALVASEKQKTVELISRYANSNVAKLYAKGNDWVRTPDCSGCARAIRKAEREVAASIKASKAEKEQADAELTKFMQTTGAVTDSVTISATAAIGKKISDNQQEKERWGSALMWFMLVSTIVFIGSTAVIVIYEEDTGEDTSYRPTVQNILKNMFVKAKSGATRLVVKGFGLNQINYVPALSGARVITTAPTPQHRPTESRNTGTQNRSQNTEQKSERNTGNRTEKTDCKSGKCDSDKGSVARETQKMSDNGSTEATQNAVLHAQNSEGQEWPTPDNKPEWDKLVKRAREWAKNSMVDTTGENGEVDAKKERTRLKNQIRWKVFVKFANAHGYRAGIGKSGVPFVNNDPEPVWSEDGTTVYFGSRSEDFDEE